MLACRLISTMKSPLSIGVLATLMCACVKLPAERSVRGLYRDLRLAVEFRENDDWVIDSLEIDDASRTVMRSVCSAPRDEREDLEAWLIARIAEEGGSSREQFEANRGINRHIKGVRRIERVLMLLRQAEVHTGECPYWLAQDDSFSGIQGNEGKFAVWAESVGSATLIFAEGQNDFGGGGGIKLLPAVGVFTSAIARTWLRVRRQWRSAPDRNRHSTI